MIHFDKFRLDNGLTVIVHADKSTPMACVNILYDVGARDEDESKTGFAHLFEHLMFGGSIHIPSYDEPLQMVGGENNAFTTNDITNYYCTVPAENLETAFWLESDRMLSLGFTDKSLEVQRQVVIEEFRQRYLNQPYGDLWLLLRPLVYKVHPYKWATIGKEIAHIENAKMEDVRGFFAKYYNPSNAVLVVAGDVETGRVKELAEKWFAEIPAGRKPVRNIPAEPVQNEARRMVVEKDVPASALYKVYHICSRKDEEYHTLDIISDILGRGASSRLYKKLVKEKQLFTEISAYMGGELDKGMFVISGKLSENIKPEVAEAAIIDQLNAMRTELISERELLKCKNKIESSLTFSETDVLTKATNLAFSELLGDASLINREVEKYAQVSAERIREQARRFLHEDNCTTLYYLSKN
jgi:zinc protease